MVLSIIVPVYNGEKYLRRCLDSIIVNLSADRELIIIDDGSTDQSGIIAEEYAKDNNNVKIIHQENKGLVASRRIGIAESNGKYISFVDADDWIEVGMMDEMLNVMENYGVDIAICGRYEVTENFSRTVYHNFPEGYYDKTSLIKNIYPRMILGGNFFEWGIMPNLWDKIYKREVIAKYQRLVDDRLSMGEDAACVYPALLNANSVYIMHKCLYYYRQTDMSMMKKHTDYLSERAKYKILFNSVNKILGDSKDVYDLRKQWLEFVLFMMVPRAAVLLKDIESLDRLFPFSSVTKGSRIIIYGMGTFGQWLYRFVRDTKICQIVACADRNYKEIVVQGFKVISPAEIQEFEYDAIVIACSFADVRQKIIEDLLYNYGYDSNKIHVIDEKWIHSNNILSQFGIIDYIT